MNEINVKSLYETIKNLNEEIVNLDIRYMQNTEDKEVIKKYNEKLIDLEDAYIHIKELLDYAIDDNIDNNVKNIEDIKQYYNYILKELVKNITDLRRKFNKTVILELNSKLNTKRALYVTKDDESNNQYIIKYIKSKEKKTIVIKKRRRQ